MIDTKVIIEHCDSYIKDILTALNLDYKLENGWIVMQCIFHNGDGYNLKYRDYSFYCFSQCRKSYTIIDVVMKALDVSFQDAVKWLCRETNLDNGDISIDDTVINARRQINRLKRMKSKRQTNDYEQLDQNILNDIEQYNHPYLLSQGFKPSTLKHFNIGFARGGTLINRIIFPIDAPNGKIISLSGRLPNADELGLPKYKVLGDSNKSQTLYNISRIDTKDEYIIVVEGMLSVLDLYEWGFSSVVAIMGSGLTDEQRRLLLGLGRKIIVIGDNDIAGQRMSQGIYNRCYLFSEVIQIKLGDFTKVDKASPRTYDIGFDAMSDLVDKLNEIIGGSSL